jgi:hypothetical protein
MTHGKAEVPDHHITGVLPDTQAGLPELGTGMVLAGIQGLDYLDLRGTPMESALIWCAVCWLVAAYWEFTDHDMVAEAYDKMSPATPELNRMVQMASSVIMVIFAPFLVPACIIIGAVMDIQEWYLGTTKDKDTDNG